MKNDLMENIVIPQNPSDIEGVFKRVLVTTSDLCVKTSSASNIILISINTAALETQSTFYFLLSCLTAKVTKESKTTTQINLRLTAQTSQNFK